MPRKKPNPPDPPMPDLYAPVKVIISLPALTWMRLREIGLERGTRTATLAAEILTKGIWETQIPQKGSSENV